MSVNNTPKWDAAQTLVALLGVYIVAATLGRFLWNAIQRGSLIP